MRVTLSARYFRKLPDKLGKKAGREYFLDLVRDKHASYGALNMTYCALKFIYGVTLKRPWEVEKIPRAKRPVKFLWVHPGPYQGDRRHRRQRVLSEAVHRTT
jgi:hypothetical protein